MKVLLADDHALFRHGVCLALQELYDLIEIEEAGTVAETFRLLESSGPYDIVLFDLGMPDADELESLAKVVRTSSPVPVVVISGSQDAAHIRGAIEAGARGYILKSSTIEALRHGLPLVLCGETYIPMPATAVASFDRREPAASGLAAGGAMRPSADAQQYRFTPRQLEVAKLLIQGHSNKQIARRLGLIEGTVKVHVRDIMRKLGVSNRTQAAIVAAQMHLFTSEAS